MKYTLFVAVGSASRSLVVDLAASGWDAESWGRLAEPQKHMILCGLLLEHLPQLCSTGWAPAG